MAKVIVIGASGFGRECLDVLDAMKSAGHDLDVLGVLDDGPSDFNLTALGQRGSDYLGQIDSWLDGTVAGVGYVVGIGDPAVREQIARRCDEAGLTPFTAVHPSAALGSGCAISSGSVICANATISTNVRLGSHVHVNPAATVGHDSALADFVSINPAATVSGTVTIGRRTLVGAGAIVLQGLTIGEDALVGAGAVITRDVPAGKIAKGVPARWT